MILYTMMPKEQVFPQEWSASETEMVVYRDVPLYVQRHENSYTIVRIASTNPSDYLDESLSPGQEISLKQY